jgi:hypothetical protein
MNLCGRPGVAVLSLALLTPFASLADVPTNVPGSSASSRVMSRTVRKPNGSGVDVQYSIEESARVGHATPVVIQFGGVTDPTGGSARFTADSGLTLSGADELRLPAGETTSVTLQATPTSEGIAYVNVFTTQNGVTSVTSIPLRAGTAAAKLRPGGELKKVPAGESVISMPAR